MSFRRILAGLAVTLAATAAGLAVSGTAHAKVVDPPGFEHVYGFDSGQCLLGDAGTNRARAWRCLNATTEQWTEVRVQVAGQPFVLFVNHATNTCLAVGDSRPVNGTPVVLKPCSADDVSQYWKKVYYLDNGAATNPHYQLHSLLGALCLDRPRESTADGNFFQVWTCNTVKSWNPFQDLHLEQTMNFVTTIG
jgi:hypothetical protein